MVQNFNFACKVEILHWTKHPSKDFDSPLIHWVRSISILYNRKKYLKPKITETFIWKNSIFEAWQVNAWRFTFWFDENGDVMMLLQRAFPFTGRSRWSWKENWVMMIGIWKTLWGALHSKSDSRCWTTQESKQSIVVNHKI